MTPKILIYGTITRPEAGNADAGPTGWKDRVKAARDRLLWAANSTALLDYRDYGVPYPTNRGDMAIAEAVRNHFRLVMGEVTFTNLNWGELDRIDAEELRSGFDLVVIAGSGYFHFSADGAIGERVDADLHVWERIGAPIVMYGVGVNRLLSLGAERKREAPSATHQDLLRRILARTKLIGVRSENSRVELVRYSDKPVRLVCDPALFLDADTLHEARQAVAGSAAAPRVGLNFAFHGPLSTEVLRQNLPAYVKLLSTLQAETGCSFHYFVHNHSEWIIPLLLRDKGLDVEVVNGDPHALVRRYREMNVHLGGMLHSCILAVGAGTPSVLLAYDAKHFGFARLLGLETHCHTSMPLDAAAVLHSLLSLLRNETEVRQQLYERLSQLWDTQLGFLRDCVALV